jgi:hypothetical protein
MSSFEIDLDDPPERWRELYAWLESDSPAPGRPAAAELAAPAPVAGEDPGQIIALYAAYLAGEL